MSFDKVPAIEKIHPKRRPIIGAYVVATQLMSELYPHVQDLVLEQPPDTHAKEFLRLVHEGEHQQARNTVRGVKPDSNRHIAFQQMLLTSKTARSSFGSKHVIPNKDFLVASHYLEDSHFKEKTDANLSITDLIASRIPAGVVYYRDIAVRNVELAGSSLDLRRTIAYTIDDSHYWLSN